ncbi:MAG: beta-eliminating lyase-related protein [Armatimonadetes bacterium]|nr:beta-eliminating lyase-related protein [Armatimonadota bacterium]
MIDLRSDTVTTPTDAMRASMAVSEVGDDVLGDDPTVARLEALGAAMAGKQAGLFMPSGTMSNTVAIRSWTQPGDEVLMDWDAHSTRFEVGAPAALAGVMVRHYRSRAGVPDPVEVASCLQRENLHAPGTTLALLENTHNVAGGTVVPAAVIEAVATAVHDHGARLHMDGARLFNAAVALGAQAAELCAHVDSVTFCLSKGLSCPVGSVLCGPSDFIERARRFRKQMGGGLRQVGVLAACGIVALEGMVRRLAEDHANARLMAERLCGVAGIGLDLETVQTNMVYLTCAAPAQRLVDALRAEGVLCLALGSRRVRLVTHRCVSADQCRQAGATIARIAAGLPA